MSWIPAGLPVLLESRGSSSGSGEQVVVKPLAAFLRDYQLGSGCAPGPLYLFSLLARQRQLGVPAAPGRDVTTAADRDTARACCYLLASGVAVLGLLDALSSPAVPLPALNRSCARPVRWASRSSSATSTACAGPDPLLPARSPGSDPQLHADRTAAAQAGPQPDGGGGPGQRRRRQRPRLQEGAARIAAAPQRGEVYDEPPTRPSPSRRTAAGRRRRRTPRGRAVRRSGGVVPSSGVAVRPRLPSPARSCSSRRVVAQSGMRLRRGVSLSRA